MNFTLDDLGSFSVVGEQLDNSMRECVKTLVKIVIFDMDNTLAEAVIKEFKKRGYIVSIISDSYDMVVNCLKNKLNLGFALTDKLEFVYSVATGKVSIPITFVHSPESHCTHSVCKGNAVTATATKHNGALYNTIAVGDGDNDICMFRNIDVGVAFCVANPLLKSISCFEINEKRFAKLLEFEN